MIAIDNRPKIYTPALAAVLKDLGIPTPTTAAIFINQLSFWLNTKAGHFTHDGQKFIYNTYQDWQEQFPCMSESSIGRMIRALCNLGIVAKESFSDLKRRLVNKPAGFQEYNRTSWISLCFEKLVELGIDLGYSIESLLGANLQNRSLENSETQDGSFRNEFSTIYKENSISHILANQERETLPTSSNTSNPSEQQACNETEAPTKTFHEHKINHESNIPAASSDIPKTRTSQNPKNNSREKRIEKYVWEIVVGRPYPAFLQWWADTHYKPQGGKWATGARSFARKEFYRDPEGAETIYEDFQEYMRTVTQACNQLQNDGQKAILPTCFIPKPEATEENTQALMGNIAKLVENGAAVLLPTKSTTPTSQCLPFNEAISQATIKALPDLKKAIDINEERRRFNDLRNQPEAQIALLNEWLATNDQDLKLEATRMTAISKFKFERDESGDIARVLSEVRAIGGEAPISSSPEVSNASKTDYEAPTSSNFSTSTMPNVSNIDWNSLMEQCDQWEEDAWASE